MRNLDIYLKTEKMKNIFAQYKCNTDEISTLEEILNLEWNFFDKVKHLNGRAYCQDDSYMFIVMRLAQHLLFSYETRFSILNDYKKMKVTGVNPIEGKYARMMKYTDEELYKEFLDKLPDISPIKRQIIIDIIQIFEKNLNELEEKLPVTIKKSRPKENKDKAISSLSYFYAELTFFSYKTLRLMKEDVKTMANPGCVEQIFQNTVIINKYLD